MDYEPSLVNREAEAGLVALLPQAPSHSIFSRLPAEAITNHSYRTLYEAERRVFQQTKSIDPVLVRDALGSKLDDIGGQGVFDEVMNARPDGRPEAYSDILLDLYNKRLLREGLTRGLKLLDAGSSVEDVQAGLRSLKTQARKSNSQSFGDLARDAWAEMRRLRTSGVDMTTGWPDMDHALGGLFRKQLMVLGGKTSTGKTSVVANIVHANLKKNPGLRVYYNGYENVDYWAFRMASLELNIPFDAFVKPHIAPPEEVERALGAEAVVEKYAESCRVHRGASVSEMRAACEEYKPDLIILDYVQRHAQKHGLADQGRLSHEVGKLVSDLQDLALEYNAATIALSQFSRQFEIGGKQQNRQRPTLSWLKESGDIENIADTVLLIDWPWKDHKDTTVDPEHDYRLLIEKNKMGECRDVRLHFNTRTLKLYDLADVVREDIGGK